MILRYTHLPLASLVICKLITPFGQLPVRNLELVVLSVSELQHIQNSTHFLSPPKFISSQFPSFMLSPSSNHPGSQPGTTYFHAQTHIQSFVKEYRSCSLNTSPICSFTHMTLSSSWCKPTSPHSWTIAVPFLWIFLS